MDAAFLGTILLGSFALPIHTWNRIVRAVRCLPVPADLLTSSFRRLLRGGYAIHSVDYSLSKLSVPHLYLIVFIIGAFGLSTVLFFMSFMKPSLPPYNFTHFYLLS